MFSLQFICSAQVDSSRNHFVFVRFIYRFIDKAAVFEITHAFLKIQDMKIALSNPVYTFLTNEHVQNYYK